MPFVVAALAAVIGAIGGFMALFGAEPGYFSGILFGLGAAILLSATGKSPVRRVSLPSWQRTILIGLCCTAALLSIGWAALGAGSWATALVGGAACAIADRRTTLSKNTRNLHRVLLFATVLAATESLVTQPIVGLAALTGAGAGLLFPVDLLNRTPRLRGAAHSSPDSGGYRNEMLAIVAFLDRVDIPKTLVTEAAREAGAGRASSLRTLASEALLEVGPDVWQAQPMAQEFARKRMLPEERKAWAARAVRMLAQHFPQNPKAGEELGDRLVPHVLAAAGHAEALNVERRTTAVLLDRMAAYLAANGRLEEAQSVRERALVHASVGFGDASAEVAVLHAHLIQGRAAGLSSRPPTSAESPEPSPASTQFGSSGQFGVTETAGLSASFEPSASPGSPGASASPGSPGSFFGSAGLPREPGFAGPAGFSGAPVPAGPGGSTGPAGLAGSGGPSAARSPGLARAPGSSAPSGAPATDGPSGFSIEDGYSGRAALAFSFAQTGDIRRDAGDVASARRDYRAALSNARFSLPRKHPLVAEVRARLAALPQPPRDEADEKRLVLGCFALVVAVVLICVGFTVVRDLSENRLKASDQNLTSVDQLVEVCHSNQRYFRDAAAFAGPEPHPAQVFRRSTNDAGFKRELFGGDVDARKNQLVACAVQTHTGPPLATCTFPAQPEIPMHEATYQVTIYETWTGRRLGSQTVNATKGQCPPSYAPPPQGKPWMLYAAPSDDQYRQALQPVLDLLPVAPPASASAH